MDNTEVELTNYFENLDVVSTNLNLITKNDTYDTKVSYVSSNLDVLSNSGLYNRPYNSTNVVYEVTISYGLDTKVCHYEVEVEGFKELNNIAATYIGGNSTNYKNLNDSIFDLCDIIYCGFAYPASDGTFTESSVNSYNFTHYLPNMQKYVIPYAHEKGTWVILSICGVDEQYDLALETISQNNDLIDKFVNNIVALINTYGFDGVDIDWEVPSDGALFTKLMSKLYSAVKANNSNHLVTAAIGGGAWQPPYYDLTNSHKYLDYINMMTYNMATSSGYHHTALYASNTYDNSTNKVGSTLGSCSVEESIKIYENFGVPTNKIIIGSGFYGIKQTRTSVDSSWTSAGSVSYSNIYSNYLSDTINYIYNYDSECQVPYLLSANKLTFITYENEISVLAKCEYAKNNNLAGVFAWQYALDNGDLLKTLSEGLS